MHTVEAVFYCEDPPEIEYRDGLFHVTQIVGAYRWTRVMQPSTFNQTMARGDVARIAWQTESATTGANCRNVTRFRRKG